MTHIEAMNTALDVLKNSQDYIMGRAITVEAVQDIEQAIEQAEKQEPVGYLKIADIESQREYPHNCRSVNLWYEGGEGLAAVYTSPQPQKPSFKTFIKWAGEQGYDCAQTCNSDTGEWLCLNPMTADLWKAWQAAHNIKSKR